MSTPSHQDLLDTLAPTHRLALAYAPVSSRPAWTAFLALDARLAGVVRSAREPLLGQLRLAWWRERLGDKAPPRGEPLLASLAVWGEHRAWLVALVDGWEALLGEAPLGEDALSALAEGRGRAVAALAHVIGAADYASEAARVARGWGLSDLAAHVSHPDERAAVLGLMAEHNWRSVRLPRGLRPLVVLHGLARARREGGEIGGLAAFFCAIRLGIFGR